MNLDLDQAAPLLGNTPGALRSLLWDLGSPWIQGNEGWDTWSPHAVVGHLVHAERTDWMPRVRWILAYGATRAFEPFDRFAQLRESGANKTTGQLLDEFAVLRKESLRDLRALGLSADDLEVGGLHPELGPVTLRQLLAAWVVHDMDHVTQIARVMAKQYTNQVGPWAAYLTVLRDRSR